MLHSIGRVASAPVQGLVHALIASLDALNGLVARLYDRYDAGFSERTKLLRARYARTTALKVAPPPSVSGIAERATLLPGDDKAAA